MNGHYKYPTTLQLTMSTISILELAGVAHLPKARHLIESVILIEGYKEAQVEFGSVAGEDQAKQTIDQFRDLVNRNQVQGNERNIDYWRKQGWDQFSAFVQEKSQEKSKTQIKRSKTEGRSVVLHETPRWLVVVPLDKDASCFHGKNTYWCTTKPFAPQFEEYFYDDEIMLIYFLKLDSGDKWAIAAHSKTDKMEMFDQQDRPINEHQFYQQTGLDPKEFRNKVFDSDDIQYQATETRKHYRTAIARIRNSMPFDEIDKQVERDLIFTKNIRLIIDYCEQIKGRWPEAERMIVRSPEHAIQYAHRVIHGRWPPAEPHIIDSVNHVVEYARLVIQGDWPEAESAIMQNINVALDYVDSITHSRWVEAEPMWLAEVSRKLASAASGGIIDMDLPENEFVLEDWFALDRYREKYNFSWPQLDRVANKYGLAPYIKQVRGHREMLASIMMNAGNQ